MRPSFLFLVLAALCHSALCAVQGEEDSVASCPAGSCLRDVDPGAGYSGPRHHFHECFDASTSTVVDEVWSPAPAPPGWSTAQSCAAANALGGGDSGGTALHLGSQGEDAHITWVHEDDPTNKCVISWSAGKLSSSCVIEGAVANSTNGVDEGTAARLKILEDDNLFLRMHLGIAPPQTPPPPAPPLPPAEPISHVQWVGHSNMDTQTTPGDACCTSRCGGWSGGVWSDALILSGDTSTSGPKGIHFFMPHQGHHVIVGLTSTATVTSYTDFTSAIYFQPSSCITISNGNWGSGCGATGWQSADTEWLIMAKGDQTEYWRKVADGEWVKFASLSTTYPLRAAVDIYETQSQCRHGPRGMTWVMSAVPPNQWPSPPSPPSPPPGPVEFLGHSPAGEFCRSGGVSWSYSGSSAALLTSAPGGISFTMPFAGNDVRIGLSKPGDGTNFAGQTYGVYFRGADSGASGDLLVDYGQADGVQHGPGTENHLLGSGQDWSGGEWASKTWSFRVSADKVDFLAGDLLLYTWTGAVTFPLKVDAWIYAGRGSCNSGPRNVKWL